MIYGNEYIAYRNEIMSKPKCEMNYCHVIMQLQNCFHLVK